ncbi:erythromycin esterase family protein [Amycolatopsis keratiniphila]|uniref:erythromycin esterase family protein n=1 Tax=Amycolatopsis keratiniphila TaxID=129921 RepID=UPI0033D58DC3
MDAGAIALPGVICDDFFMELKRRTVMAAALATSFLIPAVAQAAPADRQADPARALEQVARPLLWTEPGRPTVDLRALGQMIGDAKVVGLGEATHGSHEFFAMKERVFRYLVEQKGFTAFALEVSWSAGVSIDEYLQTGKGDVREVVAKNLAGSPWDREEFVNLLKWMRAYNRDHPGRTVHFLGHDIGAPAVDDAFFERVTGYVRREHPEKLSQLKELYSGLRPIDAFAYLNKPLAERRQLANKAKQALDLVSGMSDPWVVQHARNIARTAEFLSVDAADEATLPDFTRLRDRVMAENVEWWQRQLGGKILTSAHNNHVGYLAADYPVHPKTQGAFLRDVFGRDYVPIGFTFDRGSFLSTNESVGGGDWQKFTVGPAAPDTAEATLDRVAYKDFYLDLRTAPTRARAWLEASHPTRFVGTQYPTKIQNVKLTQTFDVVIHLHDVTAAVKRS